VLSSLANRRRQCIDPSQNECTTRRKASDNDMATSPIAKARDYKLRADALKSESAYSPPGMVVKTVSDTNQC